MKEYQLTLDDALAYVKSKRSCINPNDGFIQQLRAYEGILSARLVWGGGGNLLLFTEVIN